MAVREEKWYKTERASYNMERVVIGMQHHQRDVMYYMRQLHTFLNDELELKTTIHKGPQYGVNKGLFRVETVDSTGFDQASCDMTDREIRDALNGMAGYMEIIDLRDEE